MKQKIKKFREIPCQQVHYYLLAVQKEKKNHGILKKISLKQNAIAQFIINNNIINKCL